MLSYAVKQNVTMLMGKSSKARSDDSRPTCIAQRSLLKRLQSQEITTEKKRQCNEKAQCIVEQLLEAPVHIDWFLQCLDYIAPSHFQDVIEERAISKRCGYPLCPHMLNNVAKQQFCISTKSNKVYDITERKKFCCSQCYKAAIYIKDQLLTSPLWLRNSEEIPKFEVLPPDFQSGDAGEEVDLGYTTIQSEVEELKENNNQELNFTSVSEFTVDSLSQLSVDNDKLEQEEKQLHCKTRNSTRTEDTQEVTVVNNEQKCSANSEDLHVLYTSKNLESDCKIEKSEIIEENLVRKDIVTDHSSEIAVCNLNPVEKTGNVNARISEAFVQHPYDSEERHLHSDINIRNRNADKNSKVTLATYHSKAEVGQQHSTATIKASESTKQKKKKKITTEVPLISSVVHIEKCVREWFTVSTMHFILGGRKMKELAEDRDQILNEYLKSVEEINLDVCKQKQYTNFCKKSDVKDIDDGIFDIEITAEEELQQNPLPEYSSLKTAAKDHELKVKAFLKGKLDYSADTKNTVDIIKKAESKILPEPLMPLVDSHAQNALRRRIVMDHLNQVVPDLLSSFAMTSQSTSADIRNLVSSFSLGAHNITFKPAEWSLIGLIVIKMLSFRDKRLKTVLSDEAQKYLTMMLMSFQLDGGYLDRLMTWLMDIDYLMEKV